MFDERDVSFVYGEGMCYTQHTTVCDIHTAHYVWLCAVIFAALFASSNFHTYQVKMQVRTNSPVSACLQKLEVGNV